MKNLIEKYINKSEVKFLIIVSVVALVIRCLFLEIKSSDYTLFLSDWCNYLKFNGGFKGIVTIEADYNAIYLYFLAFFTYLPVKYLYSIKFLSIIFDYMLAIASYLLVGEFYKDNSKKKVYCATCYAIVLFLPTVILNSSFWAQCDSIYTSFIFISLYFIIKKKYNICFILFGIAITFKLQAIFFLPVYGIIYLKNRDFSIFKFLWIPLVNFVLYIPAIMLGKPVLSVIDAYFTQVQSYDYKTVYGYPNLYNLLPLDSVNLIKPGIIITMATLAVLAVIVLMYKPKLNSHDMIKLSIACIFIVTYLLPKMHDRYAFAGEILIVIYYIISRENLGIVVLTYICAMITYATCLLGLTEYATKVVSVIQVIPVIFYTYSFVKSRLSNMVIIQET